MYTFTFALTCMVSTSPPARLLLATAGLGGDVVNLRFLISLIKIRNIIPHWPRYCRGNGVTLT